MISERFASGMERARRYLSPRVLILLYHRIADGDSDPWQLAVTPKHFEEHLQVLRKYGRLMSLRELCAAAKNARLPRRGVVVTFDDGYADNLLTAKPLLQKYDVPATVFISTGYTGQDREFWWDELDRLLIQPGVLPDTLSIRVRESERQWALGNWACYDESSHQLNRKWSAAEGNEPTPRHSLYRSLWQLMHPMLEDERLRLREELLAWAGASGSARETHRVLGCEEIAELARDGLIEVGSHTVTHPQLSALDGESQRDEIRGSKLRLEEIVDRPVTAFAYPYGRECDYTAETVSLVREAGFDGACTTTAGVVERCVDPLQMPRVQVQDTDGESFARLISEWLY